MIDVVKMSIKMLESQEEQARLNNIIKSLSFNP